MPGIHLDGPFKGVFCIHLSQLHMETSNVHLRLYERRINPQRTAEAKECLAPLLGTLHIYQPQTVVRLWRLRILNALLESALCLLQFIYPEVCIP